MTTFGFQWHITDKCPNRCLHCYQSDYGGDTELPIGELIRIADHIISGINNAYGDTPISINITGGEPLLYGNGNGDVFELMSHLSTYNCIDELNIITSTCGMDIATVNKFKTTPKLTHIKVSLESNDPLINDYIRGSGHYKMATRNINTLTQSGLSVIIMATLCKHNYHSVSGLCSLAASLGARGVMLERYVPLGHGLGLKDSVLTSREWHEVIRSICRVANINIETDTGTDTDASIDDMLPYRAFMIDMPYRSLGDGCSVSGAPCCLGPSSMALMPDGTVYPCRRVPIPIGKLPFDNMSHILKTLDGYSSKRQKCFGFDF